MSKAARVLGREPTQFGKLCRMKGWRVELDELTEADE